MKAIKRLDGSTDFHILDLKLSATVVEGQPVIASGTGTDGGVITDPTTTSLADMVGIVLGASSFNPHGGGVGTLTFSTTQADTEGLVRVIINPDAIIESRMSGGATTGTSLSPITNTSASAGGTTVTGTHASASLDDGIAWGLAGNNQGLSRKITTWTSTTSFVVTVPFPRAIAVNDTYLAAPYLPLTTRKVQLTSDFLEADASIAVGTGGDATIVEVVLQGIDNSFVRFIARDHVFNELS